MATLSCAMVGPMDGIGLLNATRVMMTCRGDGVVLKPDKPATTVDSCFRDRWAVLSEYINIDLFGNTNLGLGKEN